MAKEDLPSTKAVCPNLRTRNGGQPTADPPPVFPDLFRAPGASRRPRNSARKGSLCPVHIGGRPASDCVGSASRPEKTRPGKGRGRSRKRPGKTTSDANCPPQQPSGHRGPSWHAAFGNKRTPADLPTMAWHYRAGEKPTPRGLRRRRVKPSAALHPSAHDQARGTEAALHRPRSRRSAAKASPMSE